jgi:hypothetical protein
MRVWPYCIRSKRPFVLPSQALPSRLDGDDKHYLREALLANGHDAILWEWVRGPLMIPLTPDIVFLDVTGTVPFRSSPSVQHLNEPKVLIAPAKRGRVWRAKRANRAREV